jgi:NAD(P)-dependent dehydrogenase (short-subunit alcohol dehydrogenase family)
MAERLRNKIILVTGSTTGVGEATARRCVEEGARVMVHGLEEEWARVVCSELGADCADFLIADLAVAENCARLVGTTVARFGGIDAVVNNAALTTRSTLESTDAAFFDRMIGVNLRAPLLILKAAVSEFRKRGCGTVVNIGSVNALAGQPNLLDYSISKGGLATMTRNLANALATERIRVNQLNLGWVASRNEIALKMSEGLPEGWHRNLPPHLAPRGYILEPHEIAAHVVFWLSEESAPANGVVYELEQFSVIGRNFPKTSL